jgi:hypothetical protein
VIGFDERGGRGSLLASPGAIRALGGRGATGEQPVFVGCRERGGAVVDAELAVDPFDVLVDGAGREE